MVCGVLAARYLKEIGKPVDWAYEFVFAAIVGGLVGARLWWVAENWSEAQDDLLGSLFSGSGLVFYGGALGGAITVLAWSRHLGFWEGRTLDMGAAPLAAGYAIGRIGCQLAGDGDYGVEWDGPWAMAYPEGTVPTTEEVHPTPVYETLAMGLVTVLLWRWRHRWQPGTLFALWAMLAGVERFLVEFVRRNPDAVLGLTTASAHLARHDRRRRAVDRHARRFRPRRDAAARLTAIMARRMAAATAHVYPEASTVRDGRLEIGGCDAVELAREHGTPAYVVAEDDLRARARVFLAALEAAHDGPGEVVFASKAFPCTAALRVFAEEGLGCDVASGGELHLALRAGFAPERLYLHGNAKSEAELAAALDAGVGTVVLDSVHDAERLSALLTARGRTQRVLIRVTPGVDADTHEAILTGQAGLQVRHPAAAGAGAGRAAARRPGGRGAPHAPGLAAVRARALPPRHAPRSPRWASSGPTTSAAASASRTRARTPRPTPEAWVAGVVEAARAELGTGHRLVLEPGRALTASAGVTLYTVESVKPGAAGELLVAVDGGMSDNLRPMLYGASYEAHLAARFGEDGPVCTIVGKHCESGDVLVRDVRLPEPAAGRRARDAGHRRLRVRDGQQLQRRPAAPGRVLLPGPLARGRAARDLRGPQWPRPIGSASSATGRSAPRSRRCWPSAPARWRRSRATGRRSAAC